MNAAPSPQMRFSQVGLGQHLAHNALPLGSARGIALGISATLTSTPLSAAQYIAPLGASPLDISTPLTSTPQCSAAQCGAMHRSARYDIS